MQNLEKINVGIIGMGYVGLPLAVEFGKVRKVIGFDINEERIKALKQNQDKTLEISEEELVKVQGLKFTNDINDLSKCNFYIVCVPTPITDKKKPDLTPILSATKLIANVLKKGDTIVYESTVFPGVVEDHCCPVIEDITSLKLNNDFFLGYSPERINPGDKKNTIRSIVKITSGSNNATSELVDSLYRTIISAGTYKASSIKVAEAAKVIENIQRDVNIALINELSIIFNKLDIDTEEVLKAAETKWNFIPFKPGLVGGHCIGVDPYYLSYKSEEIGYIPQIINAGRKMNDGMAQYICSLLLNTMSNKKINLAHSKILIMGYTFKENCPDTRNTKVKDIANILSGLNINVDIFDPWISEKSSNKNTKVNFIKNPENGLYDALIIAVAHEQFLSKKPKDFLSFCKTDNVIVDLKHIIPKEYSDIRL
jgi:UDP-N-acetyl-D-glucosamine/UDP-N-acetyl-D-galactosamine dehydrogenase